MSIIILDYETTGLDVKTALPIEIGVLKVDDNLDVIEGFQSLMYGEKHSPISDEISKLTHIDQKDLEILGKHPIAVYKELGMLIDDDVEVVIAYNREYDQAIFIEEMGRYLCGLVPGMSWLLSVPWLCAMKDIESNYNYKCWKLSHLALDYGCAIDGSKLHRAMADVHVTRDLMLAAGTTPQAMYAFQQVPWVYLQAKVAAPWEDGGIGVALAKQAGYTWERPKGDDRVFAKTWVKRVKKTWLEKELANNQILVKEIK